MTRMGKEGEKERTKTGKWIEEEGVYDTLSLATTTTE